MNRINDKYPVILFFLWVAFFFLPIGNRGLWNPDEPRYLQVAWEMAKAKSYLIPIFNGEFYAHKPPLLFWLTILVSKLSGFESASRYVSAIMSLGTIQLTYLLGKKYGNREIGFVAALILMTCGLFLWLTGTGNIDTTLTFLTTLSLFSFVQYQDNKKWFWMLIAYISCGLGALAKGPVALFVPWLIFLFWTVYRRYLKKEKISYLHLIWGPFLAIGIASIWLIPACISGGEAYTKELLITHNIGRAVKSFAHQNPWYYYLINFPGTFAPWSLVFLAALFGMKKELKESERPVHFYLIWFCTTFLFFSLFSGKRGVYLLPAYPAFSLFLSHVINGWNRRAEISFAIKFNIVLIFSIGILLFLTPALLPFINKKIEMIMNTHLIITRWHICAAYGIGVLSILMLWMAYTNLKTKKTMAASMFMAFAILLYLGVFQTSIIPHVDPMKSLRLFSTEIKEIVPKESTIAFYKNYSQSGWNFYLNRPVIPVVSKAQLQSMNPPYDFLLYQQRDTGEKSKRSSKKLAKKMSDCCGYTVVDVKTIGSKQYTLFKFIGI